MESDPEYRAPWWLPGGHAQTIAGALVPAPRIDWRRTRWDTPDGDFIDVDWAGAADAPRTLALFHGLEGSSASPYARAIARAMTAAGWRVAVPHFRGCSGEPNRLPRAYHSGDADEVDWILRRLARESGALCAAGISLGGNALLLWLGTRGAAAGELLARAAAVSAPIDLPASGAALDRGLNRLLYTRMFLASLKARAFAKRALFPDLFDAARVRAATTLREFDDAVTAPLHGFDGVDDYWRRAAAGPWLTRIAVPTLVVNARNDPFLPGAALEAAARGASRDVLLEFFDAGGHVGFPGRGGWLPRRLAAFFSE